MKQFLSKNFGKKDMDEVSYAIGIKIHRDRHRGILDLSFEIYIYKDLKTFQMLDYSPSIAPM